MKKSEQVIINNEVLSAWENAKNAWCKASWTCKGKRLRSCTAWVYETEGYYFLQSYNAIVAFIDKSAGACYDVLRYVYGYTATSAQHIHKFAYDYGIGKCQCANWRVYYPV